MREKRLHAPRELGHGQLAHVNAVQPAQLALVEARRVAADALEREALDQLLGAEHGLVVAGAPAEQRQVVAHRLGQVAGVAQLLHRRGAVALGQLLAVGTVQQRQMRVDGRRPIAAQSDRPCGLEHEQLLGSVRQVVLAAHDVRDPRVEVVDRDREVVQRRAVRARDHGVVEMHVLEARLVRGSRPARSSRPGRARAAAPLRAPRARPRKPRSAPCRRLNSLTSSAVALER